jgi:copper chaperone NosL
MKKSIFLTLLVTMAALLLVAAADPDLTEHASCKYCGMNRQQFAHSRMLITYSDGTSVGTCSIRCGAVEYANALGKTLKSIQVGDFNTKALINAETATWVLVAGKQGVMTQRAKWAFEKRADADAYVKENGGTTVSFEDAMKGAFEDLYGDTKMIRQRRAAMAGGQQQR